MRRSLGDAAAFAPAVPTGVSVRPPTPDDAEALAVLMDDAYRGAIDAEPGQGLDDARQEIAETFAGAYGELMPEASFLASDGGEIVSACLVTRLEGAPFVAFTMTRADHKGRGLSTALLTTTLHALAAAGEPHVDLVVTAGNEPAERIYASLGFEVVDTLEH
jgi:ribosomal protein S18 acetylase RimI-like enzyme